ncbi:MAG: fibronectin type III domain-containing protein [Elusimicrobia bacterium]|nr:fibronectin type III domain-containing protein [Elusimicrobiota bacterium]
MTLPRRLDFVFRAPILFFLTVAGCQSKDRFMGAAPSTSDPLVGQVAGTSAVVYWTTSEPTTSEIQYGPDTLYGSVGGVGGSAMTTHEVTLSGLAPSTLYHFRVKNRSSAGETLYSYDRTFQTPGAGVTLPLTGEYDFETGVQQWVPQTYQDSRSVLSIIQTGVQTYGGSGALQLNVDLRAGGHPELSKGEVYVEFKNLSPVGVPMGFIDLDLVEISAWVYAPAEARGDDAHPNGVQLFVKDTQGRSEYGPYFNLVGGAWFEVKFSPGEDPPEPTPGFDYKKVAMVGVKVGVGDSSAGPDYDGPIYVDSVGF